MNFNSAVIASPVNCQMLSWTFLLNRLLILSLLLFCKHLKTITFDVGLRLLKWCYTIFLSQLLLQYKRCSHSTWVHFLDVVVIVAIVLSIKTHSFSVGWCPYQLHHQQHVCLLSTTIAHFALNRSWSRASAPRFSLLCCRFQRARRCYGDICRRTLSLWLETPFRCRRENSNHARDTRR